MAHPRLSTDDTGVPLLNQHRTAGPAVMGSPDAGPTSPVATRAKGRKYGFACLSCRRKKIKCDGNKPTCINCSKSKEPCLYRDNPAFAGYLGEELRKSKLRIQELESVIQELAGLDSESRDLRLASLASDLEQGTSPSLESDEPVSYGGSVEYSIDENGHVRVALKHLRFVPSTY